ncbi:MAG TPA: TIGR03016 family PEP-CTERM system-associated outer membrane protein [Plasticicumulans sp.]|nr:TIGR03016 family PEP-CTERM system-associated outer membrane protein [Plasticicumulans sp.]
MSKRTRQFGRGCLSLFVLVSGTAAAGDVTMQSSLSVSGTLTDNITRGQIQSDGSPVSKGDFITEIRPSIGGRSQGAGLKYDFNYELSAVEYFHDTARNAVNNRFRLNGTAEVVEDRFLLDFRSAYFQVANAPSADTLNDPLLGSGGYSNVGTLTLTPIWREHLGSFADSEMTGTLGLTTTSDQSDNVGGASASASDSTVLGIDWRLSNGRSSGNTGWSVVYSRSVEGYADGNLGNDEREHAEASVRQGISREWALLGRVGLENNSTHDISEQEAANGNYWSGGLGWTPSRVLGLDAWYGSRDKELTLNWNPSERTSLVLSWRDRAVGLVTGPSWNLDFRHRTAYSDWTARYSEEVTNSQGVARKDSNFLSFVNPQTGEVVYFDPATGRLLPASSAFSLNNESFLRKRFSLGNSYQRGHSQFNSNVFHESREYEASGRKETSLGLDASWIWQFAPRTRSVLAVNWERVSGDDSSSGSGSGSDSTGSSGDSDYLTGRIGLSHQLSADADALIEYAHTTSDGGSGGFGSSSGGSSSQSYDENRLTLSINMRF